jgi:hypothetical protein
MWTLQQIACPRIFYHAALNRLSRKALVSTDTELMLMAAAAKIGLSKGPPKR